MSRQVGRTGRTAVVADATTEDVWRVVADPTQAARWSHECYRVEWLDGRSHAAVGARFRGSNRSGRMRWSRTCEVVCLVPGREIAWRTVATRLQPDSTEWRITLEPAGTDRTLITQTFRVTRMARWLGWLLALSNPLHIDRSAALAEDLRRMAALATRNT